MTDTSPAAKWPLTLADPVRAVHYALEWNGDCPYSNPESCPRETEARDVIDAYRTWLAAHPTADDRTVIDGQPRESGPVAPHGPHSPSGVPEGPATRDRAADGRTGIRCAQHPTAPAIGGTCGACTIHPTARTTPDNRTDSPETEQDSTPDTETDSPVNSADTVRPTPDTPPMDPVHILGIGAPTALESAPAEAERDQAYRERAHLLAWIAALHPANAVITTADDIDEPGWQLLYLLVGGWQMSWHIHPRDALLFAHVEHATADDPRAQWDGHSTTAKYERIREHTERLSGAGTHTAQASS